jgi:hypothetical protein
MRDYLGGGGDFRMGADLEPEIEDVFDDAPTEQELKREFDTEQLDEESSVSAGYEDAFYGIEEARDSYYSRERLP